MLGRLFRTFKRQIRRNNIQSPVEANRRIVYIPHLAEELHLKMMEESKPCIVELKNISIIGKNFVSLANDSIGLSNASNSSVHDFSQVNEHQIVVSKADVAPNAGRTREHGGARRDRRDPVHHPWRE